MPKRWERCVRIRQACAEISPQELRNIIRNIRKRYQKRIELDGQLVEI